MNLVELVIKTLGPKKILSDEEEFEKSLNSKRKYEYKIPDSKFNSNMLKEEINGCEIIHFVNKGSDKIIIYLHGGGYVKEANLFQFNFINQIYEESKNDVYFPIYPLAPNHKYKDAYNLLLTLYDKLLNFNKDIIIIGDSAGGGLALGFTQYLNELKFKLPSKLILISPWVDVSMSNPDLEKYEDEDPMLSIYGLKKLGKLWAGNLDLKNYKVSPIYGDLKNIPKTILYTGTREVFYPDICLLYEKLKENNVDVELIVGENMNHIYPIFPTASGSKARKHILTLLK